MEVGQEGGTCFCSEVLPFAPHYIGTLFLTRFQETNGSSMSPESICVTGDASFWTVDKKLPPITSAVLMDL